MNDEKKKWKSSAIFMNELSRVFGPWSGPLNSLVSVYVSVCEFERTNETNLAHLHHKSMGLYETCLSRTPVNKFRSISFQLKLLTSSKIFRCCGKCSFTSKSIYWAKKNGWWGENIFELCACFFCTLLLCRSLLLFIYFFTIISVLLQPPG